MKPIFKSPPCPVHSGSGLERVIKVPDGYLAIIGPPGSIAMYTSDPVRCTLVLPVPLEHPAQLLIAMAPVIDEWTGGDIEPLRGGAFALCAGVVVECDADWNVCLYDERLDRHTIMANWLLPSPN